MKGSIYMVFDYMDHDLTGLMEREGHRFTVPQVWQQVLKRHIKCFVLLDLQC